MKATYTILAALFVAGGVFNVAAVTTDPVGFVPVSVPAKSDYALGTPLHRRTEYQGTIQSISGNTIRLAGTPGWAASRFVYASGTQPKTYYVRIDSGTKEGLFAKITANDTTSITVTPATGDTLAGILTNDANVTGDRVSIIPYWTPSTLLSGVPVGTQLLVYPKTTVGTNQSALAIYGFSASNAWLKGLTNVDDAVLDVGEGIVLRNNSSSAISFIVKGRVPMARHRLLLRTLAASTSQDVRFY